MTMESAEWRFIVCSQNGVRRSSFLRRSSLTSGFWRRTDFAKEPFQKEAQTSAESYANSPVIRLFIKFGVQSFIASITVKITLLSAD